MGRCQARGTRRRYHHHRCLTRALANFGYPNVGRRIFRQENRDHRCRLLRRHEAQAGLLEGIAQAILNNFVITFAERRTVLHRQSGGARTGDCNDLSRELLLRLIPIRRTRSDRQLEHYKRQTSHNTEHVRKREGVTLRVRTNVWDARIINRSAHEPDLSPCTVWTPLTNVATAAPAVRVLTLCPPGDYLGCSSGRSA